MIGDSEGCVCNKDEAFEMLDAACNEHDLMLFAAKTHAWFDPLRTDPRFAALIERIGLDAQ